MDAKVRAQAFDTPWKQVRAQRRQVLPWALEKKLNAHLDVVFTQRLYNLTQSQLNVLEASFVYPAIGSFHDHATTSDRTVDLREGEWEGHRVQEGTRRESGGKDSHDRQLMALTVSSSAVYVNQMVIPSENRRELMGTFSL